MCKNVDIDALICESCELSKEVRKNVPSSPSHAAVPLELIHCDVWGPVLLIAKAWSHIDGVFIDDCTSVSF